MNQSTGAPPPRPLALRKRRWTLIFTLPFAVTLALCGLGSVMLLHWLPGNFGVAAAAVCAFTYLCVAGAIGKSALDTLATQAPSLIIDQDGLTDVSRNVGPIPWRHMRRVDLDDYEGRIVVSLIHDPQTLIGAARRVFDGGDMAFSLAGLSYDAAQLEATLKAFHSQAMAKSGVRVANKKEPFFSAARQRQRGDAIGFAFCMLFGAVIVFIAVRGVYSGTMPALGSGPDIAFAQAPGRYLLTLAGLTGAGVGLMWLSWKARKTARRSKS